MFRDQLRAADVAVFRMYGTNNLLAIAELRSVPQRAVRSSSRLRQGGTDGKGGETTEDEALIKLRESCQRRNRTYHTHGLERPDIVAYLSESAVRTLCMPALRSPAG
jgi:hypothetical protein